MNIAAIILAAGASSRMGEPKLLLPVGGRPMVRCVAEAVCAAGLAQVVLVVGAHGRAVRDAVGGLPLEIVDNVEWATGMSSSLRAGLAALAPEAEAALVVLADQPGVSTGLVQAVVDAYETDRAPLTAPFFRGRRGSPVLFDRALFPELLAVEGDEGGRRIVARYQERMAVVEIDDAELLRDVDTRQDYEDVTRRIDEESTEQ